MKIAKEVDDRAEEGKAYENLGNTYQCLSDYQKAIEGHEKQLEIALEIGDRGGESRANGNLGNTCMLVGDYRKAIKYWALGYYRRAIDCLEKKLKIAIEVDDRSGEGRTYENLGNAYQSLRDHQKAMEYYEKQLEIAIEISDRSGEGRAYGSFGIA